MASSMKRNCYISAMYIAMANSMLSQLPPAFSCVTKRVRMGMGIELLQWQIGVYASELEKIQRRNPEYITSGSMTWTTWP